MHHSDSIRFKALKYNDAAFNGSECQHIAEWYRHLIALRKAARRAA